MYLCARERERKITMGKARGRGNLYCTLINIVTVIEFYTNLSVLNNLFVQKFFFRVLDLFCYKTNEINKDDKNLSFLTMGRSSCNTHFPPMLGNQTLSTLSSHHSSMVSMAACYRRDPGFKSQQEREFINF